MAETSIEWTVTQRPDLTIAPGYTFNGWEICTPVSEGCANCYASARHKRFTGESYKKGVPRRRTSEANWRLPLKWDRQAKEEGVRRKVFCASLSDVFDAEVPAQWRADLFDLICATPNLDWLLLTKRPQNIRPQMQELLESKSGTSETWAAIANWMVNEVPLPNVWLGASVENQKALDSRIPELLKVAALIHFISAEPLLGPLDFLPLDGKDRLPVSWLEYGCNEERIDWVICGGESGPDARPMHPTWARAIRDQCAAAGVPFFFKQWGEWAETKVIAGGDLGGDLRRGFTKHVCAYRENDGHYRRGDVYMSKVGKKKSGRLLDGRTWDEMPEVTS